jgi:histidine ammonia-lyase
VTLTADPVEIGARPTTVDDIVRIADGASPVLTPNAVERINAGRAVVDELVGGDQLIYGLNTGLGHMRDVRMPLETLGAYQEAIVVGHDGAFGEPLSTRVVRAAMAVRLVGIAQGGSGASLAVAEMLVAMLDRGVHPIVPAIGSVGAGDLMHMAAIAQVATGRGQAEIHGEVLSGREALARAGLEPLALKPKDGLAFVSANGVSVGWAALVARRAEAVAELADLVVALTLEATESNLSIVDKVAAAAKPVPGQAESARRIWLFLTGSTRCTGPQRSVQDPLSFRVAPQVHGAYREFARFLRSAVEIELAAMDDNPLVDAASNRMISNGNFHPIAMALAADALRPAIAHVGQLSDRRMNHLWPTLLERIDLTSPEAMLVATELGGPLLRYAAATRAAELREIAGPVTLDIAPLDIGVEDHATNAVSAARRSDEALDRLEDVLTVELILAWQVLATASVSLATGLGTKAAVEALERVAPPGPLRAASARFHAAVRASLHDTVLAAAEEATAAA